MSLSTISFSSPKGGSGRTLVAANIAKILAQGCGWAGLKPTTVLALDLDLRAPGFHYYMGRLAEQTGGLLRWNERLLAPTKDALRASMLDAPEPVGMLAWLTSHMYPSEEDLRARLKHGSLAAELEACWEADPRSPLYHLYELDFGEASILFVPAGDPGNQEFALNSLTFSDADFFDPGTFNGREVLQTFAQHIVARWSELRPDRPIKHLLLDQDAGRSPRAAINIGQADCNVFVGKMDDQSLAGLLSLVGSEVDLSSQAGREPSGLRVVLSQYDGRSHAVKPTWWHAPADGEEATEVEAEAVVPEAALPFFAAADAPRRKTVERLETLGLRPERQLFLIDFHRTAVQQEFFAGDGVPSFAELVRLAVSFVPRAPSGPISLGKGPLRVLGERIRHSDSALDAFARWAQRQGVEVEATGRSHEEIVAEVAGKGRGLDLKAFDLVALPAYARLLREDLFEDLGGPGWLGADAPTASDCVGPIADAYLAAVVQGWSTYARHGRRLLGYPLFVECPLVLVNPKTVNQGFFRAFREQEDRDFRGFDDPADFLDVVRAGVTNNQPNDRFIMTLEGMASWYEWLTIVTMFGADPALLGEGYEALTPERVNRFLLDRRLVHATARYLELFAYADFHSPKAGWEHALQLIDTNRAGLTLVWPDAPPYSQAPGRFRYARAPGLSPSECWLFCVPADRPRGPDTRTLERLLQSFLTYDGQACLVECGGLPMHRGVLNDVRAWSGDARLPALSGVFADPARLRHPPTGPGVHRFAEMMLDRLKRLRAATAELMKSRAGPLPRQSGGASPDEDGGGLGSQYVGLWHTEAFVADVKAGILEEFSTCAEQFRGSTGGTK